MTWPQKSNPIISTISYLKKIILQYCCHHNILLIIQVSPSQGGRQPQKDVTTRGWESWQAGYQSQVLNERVDSFSALSLSHFHLVPGQSLISNIFTVTHHPWTFIATIRKNLLQSFSEFLQGHLGQDCKLENLGWSLSEWALKLFCLPKSPTCRFIHLHNFSAAEVSDWSNPVVLVCLGLGISVQQRG